MKVIGIIVLLAALAAGGYFVKLKFDARGAEIASSLASLQEAKAKSDELQQRIDRAGQERDDERTGRADAEKGLAEMQANLSATRGELEELRKEHTEAEHRMTVFKMLTEKLQKMIDTGKLKVLMRGGR